MEYFNGINPLSNLSPVFNQAALSGDLAKTSPDAEKQFAKLFVNEVLKQSVAGLLSMGPESEQTANQSIFPSFDNSAYTDLMVDMVGNELIDSGAFKINQLIPNTQSADWKSIIGKAKQSWLNP